MSYFIRCISKSHQVGTLYCIKGSKPHKLNHPKSLDRDWFSNEKAARIEKKRLEALYANFPMQLKVERK